MKLLNKSFQFKKSGITFDLHKYWTKQPIEVIDECILNYTLPGETVLDCFGGTGMTGLSAIKNQRDAILYDISPICTHISEGYTKKVDTTSFQKIVDKLIEKLKKEIGYLYLTKCPECKDDSDVSFSTLSEIYTCPECKKEINVGKDLLFALREKKAYDIKCPNCKMVFNGKRDLIFKEFRPIEITLFCNNCNKKITKLPDKEDLKKWTWKYEDINDYYPKVKFFGKEPKRNIKKNIIYTYQFFSPINLKALSRLWKLVNTEKEYNQPLKFIFTSILFNVSLMSAYREYENTSIKSGTLYIPSIIKDNNVITSFENKSKKYITFQNKVLDHNKKLGNIKIHLKSSTNMKDVEDNSVDYVYIDPPYSDLINYSELNIVWESWLDKVTNNSEEIIVDDNKKDNKYYATLMHKVFLEINKKLKKDKYMTLIFHNSNPSHWRLIQEALIGTNLKNVNTDTPNRVISNSKTHSQRSTDKVAQGFLLFNYVKKKNHEQKFIQLTGLEYSEKIKSLISLAKTKNYKTKPEIYDFVINSLFKDIYIENFNLDDYL